ncbi:MAG: mechanosensitive ion channel family protein [Gemmatimonadota bacterium]
METISEFLRGWNAVLEPYPALQALGIIVGFLFLAAVSDRIITGIVSRLVAQTQTDLDDRLLAILHRPIFTSVALLGLILAVGRFEVSSGLMLATTAAVKTILIVIWMVFGLRFSSLLLGALKNQAERFEFIQPTTEPLLRSALAVVLFLSAAYAILLAWDIEVTGLVASAGIVGLALSFAAKDTLANLFAGVAILADQPYKLGEYIILDSGERGEVTHIGLRSTRLLTRDDVEVSIPNSVMGGAKIVNEASGVPDSYRIRVAVGVAYGSDIDHVMSVLMKVGTGQPEVRATPEPRVRFRRFGESSLDFELLCWIERPADRGRVIHELNCNVYRAFAATGISIPFPQRDLYIKQMPAD